MSPPGDGLSMPGEQCASSPQAETVPPRQTEGGPAAAALPAAGWCSVL